MTPRGQTPLAEHRRLRQELRHARDSLSFTQKDVAEALDWSISKLIRIEKGVVGISVTDLKALLLHYRITDIHEVDRMVAMVRASKQTAWWHEYRDLQPPGFIRFLDLESSAVRIRQFQSLVVPGLLQSPSYIRQLMKIGDPSKKVAEQGFDIRVKRQELLADHGPESFFILDESCLYRQIGDTAVMREQMSKLLDMSHTENISIQVVPYAAGVHRGMKSSFEIMEMSTDPDDYMLLLEQPYKDQLIEVANDETREFVEIFHELEDLALSPTETRRRLEDRLKEIE